MTPIVVRMSLDVGYAILTMASLSFIGLGAQRRRPDEVTRSPGPRVDHADPVAQLGVVGRADHHGDQALAPLHVGDADIRREDLEGKLDGAKARLTEPRAKLTRLRLSMPGRYARVSAVSARRWPR